MAYTLGGAQHRLAFAPLIVLGLAAFLGWRSALVVAGLIASLQLDLMTSRRSR